MAKYYNLITFEVRDIPQEIIDQWTATNNPKLDGYALVPSAPAYDPATQKIAFVNGAWVTTNKTAGEIAAEADAAATAAETQQLKQIVQALKNGTGTSAERLARVERVCAHLIKTLFA